MTQPRIIFEDDELLVVDKPGGMICHSATRPEQLSLVDWVRSQGIAVPHMINRLDRETSGLVVLAKHQTAATQLGKQAQRREIEKQYRAICWGQIPSESGVIDQPIGLATGALVYTRRAVCASGGQPSVTAYQVESRLPRFTVVRLFPKTGRAHQLRVHLSWLGHPIVGDKIYGPDERLYLEFIEHGVTADALAKLVLPRHALHAERVRLRHPRSQEIVDYCAALPDDMRQLIREGQVETGPSR